MKELTKRPRYKGELLIRRGHLDLEEQIRSIFFELNSFLGLRSTRTKEGDRKIIASFGEEEDLTQACQMRFENEEETCFKPVTMSHTKINGAYKVIVRDILLDAKLSTIKGVFSKFGLITNIEIKLVETWQTAIITYAEQEDAAILGDTWSVPFEKEQVRILPYVDHNKHSRERAKYVVKLSGLPRGTTAYDLEEARKELEAKTVYIPRTPGYYRE